MAVLKEGDVGKIIQLDANFNLSGNTDLQLVFTKPSGAIVIKTSADGITAPAIAGVSALANEYWEYPTEAGLLDESGDGWKVHGVYIDGTPKNFCGDTVIFPVDECTIS